MTFHIIPWMWGVDGDKTCGISDSIYITDKGCESFFTMNQDFTVKKDAPEPALLEFDEARKAKTQKSQKVQNIESGERP